MRNKTILALVALALMSAAVFAVAALASSPAPPASGARHRPCGTIHGRGHPWKVTIYKGHVSCHAARRVLRAFLHGKGRMHGPPNGPAYRQYWTLYGWKCGNGAGAAGCNRHHFRQYVIAEVKF